MCLAHASMEFLLFAVLASAASAVADHGAASDLDTTSKFVKEIRTEDSVIYYTPALFYFSVEPVNKPIIKRCLVEDPDNCEVFQKGIGANHILVYMEYVYIGNARDILQCESYKKHSCNNIHKSGSPIYSLSTEGEHLYAGLHNGSILLCNLQRPYSCRTLHTFTSRQVWSVIVVDKFIYAGLDNGQLMRCSLTVENSCTQIHNMGTQILGLTNTAGTISAITWNQGLLWTCLEQSDVTYRCVSEAINIPSPRAMASFNGSFYVIKQKEDNGIYICNLASVPKCKNYGHHKTYHSIAFSYGTYHMQNYYKNEDTACTWQPDLLCPPYVTYYDVQQRAKLKVLVKDGRLYDAEGSLVDTRQTEDGQSETAIFVMGPDGRILLTNSYQSELLFASSLFAGKPVSGAGEMIVENGVIKKITACSSHYLPDLELNKQVTDSLRSQGYTKPIISEKCSETDSMLGRVL